MPQALLPEPPRRSSQHWLARSSDTSDGIELLAPNGAAFGAAGELARDVHGIRDARHPQIIRVGGNREQHVVRAGPDADRDVLAAAALCFVLALLPWALRLLLWFGRDPREK